MSSDPRPAEPPHARVAVLGLGVMGGSLARATSRTWPDLAVSGWSRDPAERDAATSEGVLTSAPADWEDAVRDADLVVLAVPLEAARDLLGRVAECAPAGATLSDVVGLKAPMAEAAERAGVTDRWVGTHPMAGAEASGFGASRPTLYDGARVWLCAHEAARSRLAGVRALWSGLGACPAEIEAEAHDRLMTLVSHLPQLVSNLLASELARRSVGLDELGPGGRDMTRLAASNPEMWRDLLGHAPRELAEALRDIGAGAADLADALEAGDIHRIESLMARTRAWRSDA